MVKSALGNLTYAKGSKKNAKRIGRGQGSGHGGTATKGHKGAKSRTGAKFRVWFEGGQMPLIRRVPKFGFHSPFQFEYQVVNVSTLDKLMSDGKLAGGKVTPGVLYAIGAVAKKSGLVKMLGEGDVTAKLDVSAHAFSKAAAEKIKRAGGTATTIS